MLDALQLDPIAFTLPFGENGFPIYWYGILIAVGIATGAWWAGREIERRGESSDQLYNGLLIVVIAGYIFARLGYVLQDELSKAGTQYNSFFEVINLRAGGANILAGFIGAALVGVAFTRYQKLNAWHYADVTGPIILIAQAIGRWGNFVNQELYGPPTTLSWGILIDAQNRIAPYNDLATYPLTTRFHPTFLYESLALLIGFIVLLYLNNRYREQFKPGTLFGLFLIWWGANRAWIELFRPDQPRLGETILSASMLVAVGIALAGVFVILQRYNKLPESESSRRRRRVPKPKRRRPNEAETE
ncbi:MAG: prolipoprotein diacylglyceryl transferase [Anaerolineales bacterium]|nr:prolipoprotein diacylglyceryl transferase [Anaerolineales bacterium]